MNHFRAVCGSMQRQRQDQRSFLENKAVHEVQQDKEHCKIKHDIKDRSADLVNIRYLNFDNIKSLIYQVRVKQ